MASPGTDLEGPRGLTEQGARGGHGEAGPILAPRASPAPGPEAREERTLLSDPVSPSSSELLPLCVEGADEASEGRREEGKPGTSGCWTQACGARVLRPSEPPLCLRWRRDPEALPAPSPAEVWMELPLLASPCRLLPRPLGEAVSGFLPERAEWLLRRAAPRDPCVFRPPCSRCHPERPGSSCSACLTAGQAL